MRVCRSILVSAQIGEQTDAMPGENLPDQRRAAPAHLTGAAWTATKGTSRENIFVFGESSYEHSDRLYRSRPLVRVDLF